MDSNRRDFLKKSGLAGLGLIGSGLMGELQRSGENEQFKRSRSQRLNMHGYAAPPIDEVGVGIIGTGNRGSGTAVRLASIEGVKIRALCDLELERVQKTAESIRYLNQSPDFYYEGEDDWKKMCERTDIDLVVIATPWHLHTPQAVFSMEHEKHVFVEVPAAKTLEECWQLVEASERTRMHCVQEASDCHDPMQATILNMARKGFFGDIVHGEGAYIHDLLRDFNFTKHMYHNMWRLNENIGKSGNLYPHHGLGLISQVMDLNYGDKMEYMVSMSGNDFSMGPTAKELAAEDDFWEPYAGREYRGNMNTSLIRTHKGRTIMLQHDVSSPRPYSRLGLVSGTKATVKRWPMPDRIATSHEGWLSQEEFDALIEEYTPKITRKFDELLTQASLFGDTGRFYERVSEKDWRLIDCLRNGLPVETNVYDAALWSSIIPLSIKSNSQNSASVPVPDFTNGTWETNRRGMNVNLETGGGTTRIL